ncbi:CDP-glucose 4,6-dehydratase [bacterium]|nr:CDP-glucose 4,6-dehydratase [bacterium]
MFNDFYKGKRVLITGHTGFKGSWLVLWLKSLGAEVLGYSLEPNTNPSMFEELEIYSHCRNEFADILDEKKLKEAFDVFQPEIVFHLAAQPLVRRSYLEPVLTYKTNVIGTLNVLEAARNCGSVKAFVNVTTDKCYENCESNHAYSENEPMGGYDMYSSSKGCVEIMSSSYRRSFLQEENSMAMVTARAGNVIGGGDWADDRLIPDCIKAINNGVDIELRYPDSVRPWQYVLEPLSGYLLLGQKLYENGNEFAQSFNFGPDTDKVLTVYDIAQTVCHLYGKGNVTVNKENSLHEAGLLTLNIEKAKRVLGWTPTYSVSKALSKSVEWYKHFFDKDTNMYEFTLSQIKEYEESILWNRNYAIR